MKLALIGVAALPVINGLAEGRSCGAPQLAQCQALPPDEPAPEADARLLGSQIGVTASTSTVGGASLSSPFFEAPQDVYRQPRPAGVLAAATSGGGNWPF